MYSANMSKNIKMLGIEIKCVLGTFLKKFMGILGSFSANDNNC